MPIPGYEDFMLPLVRLAADGHEHKITDAIDQLADQFGVSEVEREIMLPSGTQTRLYNRVTWALTYLTKSLILEKTARGRFRIAARGSEILKKPPARIDNKFLSRFQEFLAFKNKKNKRDENAVHAEPPIGEVEQSLTPLGTLRSSTDAAVSSLVRRGAHPTSSLARSTWAIRLPLAGTCGHCMRKSALTRFTKAWSRCDRSAARRTACCMPKTICPKSATAYSASS